MTGRARRDAGKAADDRRYTAFGDLRTPDGEPALSSTCDYITIWGFWNGPDELLASQDGQFYQAFNAKHAEAEGMISEQLLAELMRQKANRLARCGFEDLNPKPDHLLISFDPAQKLVLSSTGKPEVRLCNFELIRRLPAQG
jgi:hypothetical protein